MTDVPQVPTPPAGGPYPEQSQAATALVLGILSIVVCQLLGPFAWKLANNEIKGIAEGRRPPDSQGIAQAAKICGIVGTCFLAIGLAFLLFSLVALMAGFGIFVSELSRT
jgi:TRAP-type C4-dicarboxylate transport system permease small subunit